ncbi:hypothetical protein J2S08_001204 [Bacillus chungangensis]|uniref:Uncharacterized protein n=1 Tax=Bacillus chungangensis TaxID=587633 RepID=A0ABT9WQ88_9BACI|nr:hypothetical protein [Bacillus chungangensis]
MDVDLRQIFELALGCIRLSTIKCIDVVASVNW